MSPVEQVGSTLPANRIRQAENRNRRDDGKRPSLPAEDRKHARGKPDAPDGRERLIDELA